MNNLYTEILKELDENHPVAIKTVLSCNHGMMSQQLTRNLTEIVPTLDSKNHLCACVTSVSDKEKLTITEPVLPQERLIILGGGHIAVPVCDFASKSGFSVTVCDDRMEFANKARFPGAARVIYDGFENAIRTLHVTPFDYIVLITRGHRHDADCLRVLLTGVMPSYLGMIGSRHRTRGLLEMLNEEGLDQERLLKIYTPIGLDIGAVTPGEIAVSILAEVIRAKRCPAEGSVRIMNDSDVEIPTLRYLAENHEPKAIVTVIETKGSTPRKAGAKMVVNPMKQVTGSIGGGCSEAAVINDAVRLIGTGRFEFMDIDLTGDTAESDGMVCGGTMRVLIEDGVE